MSAPGGDAGDARTRAAGVWLVIVDVQRVFAEPWSAWASPDFPAAAPRLRRLIDAFGPRVCSTRFVAPRAPRGAWVDYYREWPFALRPADDPMWDYAQGFGAQGHPEVVASTFGKWGPALARATRGAQRLVMAGVATDCCVISTVLAAADAGVRIDVAADACAGSTTENHRRALAVMGLYTPLVRVTDAARVCAEARG